MNEILDRLEEVLNNRYLCDYCLGRNFAYLLTGISNKERGEAIRKFLALLLDSGMNLNIDPSNFYKIKFKQVKIDPYKKDCFICENFFEEKLEKLSRKLWEKIRDYEFETFLIGSKVPSRIRSREEKIWEIFGIKWAENLKSDINREIGKRIEKLSGKRFDLKNPEIVCVVDIENESFKFQIKSIFVFGKYKKLVRGIPQTKWICSKCSGKGCRACKGEGKLYKTSVQEEIEKPFLKYSKAAKSSFHASGREDIDARCLDFRPFVLELKKPKIRKLNLKKILKEINKSKKVNVKELKYVDKSYVRKVKSERLDKTYLIKIKFEKNVEKEKLKKLKDIVLFPIMQKTPLRVLHRRSDKVRKRFVKKISVKLIGKKEILVKLRAESGLYIKELITGDNNRTIPNFASILENKPLKIDLDIVKIHY